MEIPEGARRIYPDDPEWMCSKSCPGEEKHSCMEMHNQTGDPVHRCCCGVEWEDD